MKKLLLASIIMAGISTVTAAQTPEAVRAKKEAVKKTTHQPVISNAKNETAPAAAKVKTDAEMNTQKSAPVKQADADVKKAPKPAAKKVKQN